MGFDGQFIIIGHRGAAGIAPENTLAGFRRAAALRMDAVELDVHLVEGELVVIHDDAVDRTTNGRGKLEDFTLADLRRLDAGDGERIPLLREVLEALPAHVGVNVELKGQGTGAALAQGLPAQRDVLASSFDFGELSTLRARHPQVRCAPLFRRRHPDMLNVAQALNAWSINIADAIADALVENIRAAGFGVLVFTVNDVARAERLAALGARGVFTDRPDLLCGFAPRRGG